MNEPLSSLLSETGKQLAQRFTTALALPGLLFVAVLAAAAGLGQHHSLDVVRLVRTANELVGRYDGRPVAAVLALIGAGLAGCAAGVLCAGIAAALGSLWIIHRPALLVRPFVSRRSARWHAAQKAFQAAEAGADRANPSDQQRLAELAAARNAVALGPPTHATWIADRLAWASLRVWGQYGLDLSFSWSRLWLVLPDHAREELRLAGRTYTTARMVQAWGVLYLLVGLLWWPAAVGGAGAVLLGWRRGRAAAETLADLVEASYDLHAPMLMTTMHGEPALGPLDRLTGERLNVQLRKGA